MVEIRGLTITTPLPHSFKCNNCGLCCEGPVELSDRDYERLKNIRDDIDKFVELRKRNSRIRRILKPVEKRELLQECIFLRREADGRRLCSIYDQRPSYCRLYPLFVAYSRNLKKIYVDVLHCPGVKHEEGMSDLEILKTINEVLSFDESFIDVIPSVDRAVTFTLYHKFRDVYLDWKLKYSIVSELNGAFLRDIQYCENSIQLLMEFLRFQEKIKTIIREINDIFNIVDNIEKVKNMRPSVSMRDVIKTLNNLLIVRALARDGSLIIVDNYDKNVYSIRLGIDYLRNLYIEHRDIEIIREILYRLSTNIQTCALPVEYIYVQGYLNIILLYLIYRGVCNCEDSCLYNLDSIGVSVYSRELVKYMQSMGITYVELSER